ncbi:DUF262 domain-containing protein [Kibdelosporangium philippinense]|uniref:DUF262 domain-containing protein n=1 Tax=Kibdelosporangium philippinense TaxID=211113 RepID=A0ABS8ZD09_9PSEU|nr:DUF262 domain-containing protein [Kibdelosporangium philippinense]MCE7004933.1 DUF262 domain-containing protein [Kibdelosporangium philippinense]
MNAGAVGLDTQPSATTYDLDDLIANAWRGRIRVPHFQRDFRWSTQDVIRLFDSIVKGYPIGSLLLWVRKSPATRLTLGRLSMDAPAFEESLWVVDGQQRITSLANALHPEGHLYTPFSIYYDFAARSFVAKSKAREPHHIALPILFDLERLIEWFANEGRSSAEHFKEAQRVAKVLRTYKVPAYLVRQDDEQVLTDIFDRMNNYGKRLSRAEIFTALFAGPEEGAKDRLSLDRIADRIAERTGFGTVDTDTILSAILARRGPDPARDIRNEFDSVGRRTAPEFEEDRDTAYEKGEEALVRAVDFLQRYVGVPHLSLLVYRPLLVVMTRFFAHFSEPEENTLRLLRRLYWRVAASGPTIFGGSFTQFDRILSARIKKGDESTSIAGMIGTTAGVQPVLPNADRFRTNEAAAKVVLSSWWSRRPRSFVTGQPFDEQDLSTLLADQTTAATVAYRIFPRGLTSQQRLLAANRLFLPTTTDPVDEIPTLLTRPPLSLDEEVWNAVLESHCLDHATVQRLAEGDRDGFLAMRQEVVSGQLSNFLSRMAEWNYEDTPSLDSLDLDELDDLPE